MRGLTWGHGLYLLIFVFLLWGIGASNAPYSFNWQVFSVTWKNLKTGVSALNKGQSEVAIRLDQQSRANHVEKDAREGICDPKTIAEEPETISIGSINQLSSDFSRNDVIVNLGNPYCQTFDKHDVWKLNNGKYFIVGNYSPITARFY